MSLHKHDLKYLMYDIFEVDGYSSKMGEDADIVTVSFSLKEKAPAEDLVKFLESGYGFILDADVSPGEQHDGSYKVFVEIQRDRHIADNLACCSRYCCGNPRRQKFSGKDKLTLQELKQLEKELSH